MNARMSASGHRLKTTNFVTATCAVLLEPIGASRQNDYEKVAPRAEISQVGDPMVF